MKTTVITAAVFAISVGLSLSTAAVAEPFNSRGQEVIATVQSQAKNVRSTVIVNGSGFNDRGQDYIAASPAGSQAQKPMISLRDNTVHGWNS